MYAHTFTCAPFESRIQSCDALSLLRCSLSPAAVWPAAVKHATNQHTETVFAGGEGIDQISNKAGYPISILLHRTEHVLFGEFPCVCVCLSLSFRSNSPGRQDLGLVLNFRSPSCSVQQLNVRSPSPLPPTSEAPETHPHLCSANR